MAYSNSKLISYKKLSPNYNRRLGRKIKKITIHHMAGNLTVEQCGDLFANKKRQASSNYGIGTDGRIALYVEEKNRSWCSSSASNDYQAITIEVANCKGAPNWEVSDKAMKSLIKLCVDICKRNGIKELNFTGDAKGNLTQHNYFAATACPGAYLKSKFKYIAEEVNKELNPKKATTNNSSTSKKKSNTEIAKEVIAGKWGNGDERKKKLKAAGYDYNAVQKEVEKQLAANKITSTTSTFTIGNKVKLTSGAKYYDGKSIPGWLLEAVLYVREIDGDRIVISTAKTGAITGAVNKKYLKKI